MIYVSNHFPISSFVVFAANRFPSNQLALGALLAKLVALLPIGELPEVQKGKIVLFVKSYDSMNVYIILGA